MARRTSVPVVVVASVLALASHATVQGSEDREFVESIVPGLKALREFADKTEERLSRFRRLLGGSPARGSPDGQSDTLPEPLDPLPDPREEERLRREFLEERARAVREQFELVETTRKHLRVYVSHAVDKCRERIAARDESGARSNCGVAETKIDQCKRYAAPEINRIAERLAAKYRSRRDGPVAFAAMECDLVFSGLDDPGALLRQAEFRLPDSSCYAHADRVVEFVKTGVVQSRLGVNDASVPAYLSFIGRMCPERIAEQARLAVDAAAKAKPSPSAEAAALDLPRRRVTSSTALLQGSVSQAELERVDPSARQAREREEWERSQRNRQAGIEAEQRVNEKLAAMSQVVGQIAQLAPGRGVDAIASVVAGSQRPPAFANPPSTASAAPTMPGHGLAVCTPGVQYDAHICNCTLRPSTPGCAGFGGGSPPTAFPGPDPAQPQAPNRPPQASADRYYPPLVCASVSSKLFGNASVPCMQNNCGRSIESHHSAGRGSVDAGQCYAQLPGTAFYAACEKNDAYDRDRNQCRR